MMSNWSKILTKTLQCLDREALFEEDTPELRLNYIKNKCAVM